MKSEATGIKYRILILLHTITAGQCYSMCLYNDIRCTWVLVTHVFHQQEIKRIPET